MCTTCGCSSDENEIRFTKIGEKQFHSHSGHYHHHDHDHDHHHEHHHDHDHDNDDHNHHHDHFHNHSHEISVIQLEKDILYKNQLTAERNRGFFEALNIFSINLVSSPGSGKTSLLERTISDLKDKIAFSVIEGDQQTTNDADRIHKLNVPVIQINTGKGCHLDSEMISKAVKELKPVQDSVLMIENVGNLVCPAMFDLGELKRIVIISVTEGEDKPLKYPDMFSGSQICIINKIDLLPYLKFDLEKLKEYAKQVNPHLTFFEVSAASGEGLAAWYDYLTKSIKQ
ncbi:hydrogenase nickel incorporation protein HypB [Flavobacterium johnsoniae]|uniref:Hydrogenase accessory protein HypB n=1 Tax=Flavobacterium johnsoniae (strain ATCC 17061 / DSM 2064 / JCM 8514 / BCRC 14874 / CCUG 350202 / NBRC 14942 / NCIMB 11054 / UW101) TaxID=376686 RepID=A5FD02_FLAJ1|nr:hydrogenase nickel incorporation protein HypB [Flavobacterium johnsoniae]ABQ06915.1 hydrogenase accessory protein HypB [Flavobacterium johnsoniae UW101]OXE97227.1 hydrogenase accessory protein HypB [Flavobacterium johnsoniae UW101]WQG81252.1 hydrogenase nickel incorporation protein HypB [Flavobacterium johnsoniae UW101]SHL36719.1 Hydrogenase nickel incorporation protein HypB [Flavobacterium johnsoniae]